MSDTAQVIAVTLLAAAALAWLVRAWRPARSGPAAPSAGCPKCASGSPCEDSGTGDQIDGHGRKTRQARRG